MPLADLQEYLQRNYELIKVPVSRRAAALLDCAPQEELVEAINNNYGDFISLSAGLVGVDGMIEAVKSPLESLRTETAVSCSPQRSARCAISVGSQLARDSVASHAEQLKVQQDS